MSIKTGRGASAEGEKPRVGILAMQGDFDAHAHAVEASGGEAFLVRSPEQVAEADGLILPGGESTTIGKLMARFGIDDAIRNAHAAGTPIYGTCAGMILLAERIGHGAMRGGQPTLGLMDITVARNAFGRQVDSFEANIDAPEVAGIPSDAETGDAADNQGQDTTVRGVFIRAPYVEEVGPKVDVLARYEGKTVLVRQGNLLASSFHPELTDDIRVHRYFLQMIRNR